LSRFLARDTPNPREGEGTNEELFALEGRGTLSLGFWIAANLSLSAERRLVAISAANCTWGLPKKGSEKTNRINTRWPCPWHACSPVHAEVTIATGVMDKCAPVDRETTKR
jgi:hypothetical protein